MPESKDATLTDQSGAEPGAPTPNQPTAASTLFPLPDAPAAGLIPGQPPGAVGRYLIKELIAVGGMGVIFRAVDPAFGRDVAVKLVKERFVQHAPTLRRFLEEAQIASRLQHPGIPPVHDLGALPDGRPYLVMKLIKGQTLDALLHGERGAFTPRSEQGVQEPEGNGDAAAGAARPGANVPRTPGQLLAIFEGICQALGYAHSRGFIHRDLKPGNVMVGAFGEVQVMDWGLARMLGPGGAPTEESRDGQGPEVTRIEDPREATDPELTRPGGALGTPPYMPPEQAAGFVSQIDRRSDVFGLGAILCQMLTGRPPYSGNTADEVKLKAARADLADAFSCLDRCGAEQDLIALAKRCLAADKNARPRDAGEVAAAVAAIRQQAEQRAHLAEQARAQALVRAQELRKRRQVWFGLAATLLVGLLASTALALWALGAEKEMRRQRDRASEAYEAKTKALATGIKFRDQALAALRVMTDEVVENQLARAAPAPENREFLRKIIRQYEGFASIGADDDESRALRAEGYSRVGLMRHRLGELKEAENAYVQALALHKSVAAQAIRPPAFRQDQAKTLHRLGLLLLQLGRPKEADGVLAEALEIRTQLVAAAPTSAPFRRDLAASYNSLGITLSQKGNRREAEQAHGKALALRRELAAEFPDQPDFQRDLAQSHNNLANLLADQRARADEAEAAYRRALEIYRPLAAKHPGQVEYRQELAGTYMNLGSLLHDSHQTAQAEAAYGEARALFEQLAAEFPARPEFRKHLATTQSNLGALLSKDDGRLDQASQALAQALALRQKLVDDSPEQPDLRNDLAATLVVLAGLDNRRRDYTAAKANLDAALPHHQAALKAYPEDSEYRRFFSQNLMSLTFARAGLGDRAGALQTAQRLRDLGWDPPADAFQAARALARCIPIAQAHAALGESERQAASHAYADQAMAMLKIAVERGYKNRAEMNEERDLGPLREREDYKKLLESIQAEVKE